MTTRVAVDIPANIYDAACEAYDEWRASEDCNYCKDQPEHITRTLFIDGYIRGVSKLVGFRG